MRILLFSKHQDLVTISSIICSVFLRMINWKEWIRLKSPLKSNFAILSRFFKELPFV
jgi:hypothetical protein